MTGGDEREEAEHHARAVPPDHVLAAYRSLPSVERLASDARVDGAIGRGSALAAARTVLDDTRRRLAADHRPPPTYDELVTSTNALMQTWTAPGPQRVINATGVVLHTNLGRAPLSAAARAAVERAAGYSTLEYDLTAAARRSRQDHLRPSLRTLSGAGDAMAVTNNAAAIFLVLSVLCSGREVLVSRGEAVAIGDGFRIPSIVSASGVILVDVGTTNRTSIHDYEAAITERTAAVLRVHPSNFTISGFTERPTTEACAQLTRRRGLLLIEDTGSGRLLPPGDASAASTAEPQVADVLRQGADVVTCSGDKLCGGPQAGLIFASSDIVTALRSSPIARVVRPDKLVVAALAATLGAYLRGTARDEIPVLRMIELDVEVLEERAQRLCVLLRERGVSASVARSTSRAGGGSLPGEDLPSACVTVPDARGALTRALATGHPPVVARVAHGKAWLDLRTIDATEEDDVADALVAAWHAQEGAPQ